MPGVRAAEAGTFPDEWLLFSKCKVPIATDVT